MDPCELANLAVVAVTSVTLQEEKNVYNEM